MDGVPRSKLETNTISSIPPIAWTEIVFKMRRIKIFSSTAQSSFHFHSFWLLREGGLFPWFSTEFSGATALQSLKCSQESLARRHSVWAGAFILPQIPYKEPSASVCVANIYQGYIVTLRQSVWSASLPRITRRPGIESRQGQRCSCSSWPRQSTTNYKYRLCHVRWQRDSE